MRRRTSRGLRSGLAVALATAGLLGTAGCGGDEPVTARVVYSGQTPTFPGPAGFEHPSANHYYPLTPGLVTRLHGSDEDGVYDEVVTVTTRTKKIVGVAAVVVDDVVDRTDGSLAEKTHDYYATDANANVWYLGEDTATYDAHGRLEDREGSWRAGRDGAVPGLIMPAHPQPGQAYRQELLVGHAEDQAWVVSNDETTSTPAGHFDHVVRSYEWSRLEPGVLSVKYYAPDVGIVSEHDVAGGHETFELVSVERP